MWTDHRAFVASSDPPISYTRDVLADVATDVLSSALFRVTIDIVTGTGVEALADVKVKVLAVLTIHFGFYMTAP